MTKDEVLKFEGWLNEYDGETWTDHDGLTRTPKHISFKPDFMLFHNGTPGAYFDLREGLANYLRRIAAYLEA